MLRIVLSASAVLLVAATTTPASAQQFGSGTRNIKKAGQIQLGLVAQADADAILVDVELDQREDAPAAYVATSAGWAIVDVSDPGSPVVTANVPSSTAARAGGGISDLDYFSTGGSDFVAVGSATEVVIYDATDVLNNHHPEVVAQLDGDFGSLFAYKHSSGATLLLAGSGGHVTVHDAARMVAGEDGLLAEISTPERADSTLGYETFMAAFHGETETDRFYGAGAGGYHVYDITDTDSVKYATSAMPAAVRRGLSVSPSADGRYLVTTAEYRTAPVRIYDLDPVFSKDVSVVRVADGAWADNWRAFHLSHETRWPYVFVAAAEQGLQVFNARDTAEPYTVGSFSTSALEQGSVNDSASDVGGAVAIDVRNHDGLIAVGDRQTGVWLLELDAFDNWDGRGWGYPNISSAQDWLNGPDGSTRFEP